MKSDLRTRLPASLDRLLPLAVGATALLFVGWTASQPFLRAERSAVPEVAFARDLAPAVARLDQLFSQSWAADGLTPAPPADELQVLRRLSLALFGTIPALEEIREFEADADPQRLRHWTIRWLSDRRFAEYFAERLAVAFLGIPEKNEEPWFDGDRFQIWLAGQLLAGRPYDELVREMLTETGPPAALPAANFVTAEMVRSEAFADRLAARSARAFLGQRIDCAECHDHPFDDWKQTDFQGLAAYFAPARQGKTGLEDDPDRKHIVEDRKTLEKRSIDPCVPFHDEWAGHAGPSRVRLAEWITHPENRRFPRAIVNRIWGLMFGRPYVSPVDALPDPHEAPSADPALVPPPDLLDLLADDLREHGFDLRRTFAVIALSRPFRLASTVPESANPAETERLAEHWALFPLVSLRPEQLRWSLEQAASLQALRADSVGLMRIRRKYWLVRFIPEYGGLGENEMDDQTENIPHTVERLLGQPVSRAARPGWTSAAGRIAAMSPDAATCLEACYLTCLTRRPTAGEQAHFLPRFEQAKGQPRARLVEDLFWTLFNSPEFSWNH